MRKILFIYLLLQSLISFSQKKAYGEFTNRHDKFDDIFKSWNILSYGVGYLDSGKMHVITRINEQQRISLDNTIKEATQLELDIYPTYNKGYAWFNFSYSPDSLFPTYRTIIEVFRNLPSDFELSLGYRGNYNIDKSLVHNFTTSIAKYHGNMWTQLRLLTIHSKLSDDIFYNYSLTSRYYFESKYDYLGIVALRGIDDRPRYYTSSTNDVYMFRFNGKKSLSDSFKVSFGIDYTNQFIVKKHIHSVGFDLGLIIII